MATKAAAVKAAQTVISTEKPIKVDGVWGRGTDAAYTSVSDRTRMIVQKTVSEMGWDVGRLRPPARAGVEFLAREAQLQGISGRSLVNLLSVVDAESGFVPKSEGHFYRDPARARRIFSALRDMSDEQIRRAVAAGPDVFFEIVYGRDTSKGRELGNRDPGDGAKFAGSGLIQLTGRDNFQRFARASGIDVVNNPRLMMDPKVAAQAAIWYWKHFVVSSGSDESLQRATQVVNRGLPDSEKRQRYALASKYSQYA